MKLHKYLAIASLLAPAGAAALGVGDIRLHSSLSQILSAEIPLVFSGQDSLSTIHVSLASADEFAKAGIPRPNHLAHLQFKPVLAPGGRFAIQVSSRDVISEPYLDFLLEIESPQGKVLREFTLLLDPPTSLSQRNRQQQPPTQPNDSPLVQPIIENIPAQSKIEAESDRQRMTPPLPQQLTGRHYGPVEQGEHLLQIAETLEKPQSVSSNRMAAGLYAANPGAFHKNVRGLQAGSTLSIPSEAYLNQVSEQQAKTILKTRVNQLVSGENQPDPQTDSRSESVQTVQSPPDNPSTTVATKASALLRKENEALQFRLEQLEQKLADAQRMLELKNAELAAIHSQQQTPGTAEAIQTDMTPNHSEVGAHPDELVPEANPTPDTAVSSNAQTSSPHPGHTVPMPSAAQTPPPTQITPKPSAPQSATVETANDSSFPESTPWLLTGALGVFGIGAWLYWRRRYGETESKPEPKAPPKAPSTVVPDMAPAVPTQGKTATDTSIIAPHPLTETTVLDPIAEADVYLGYDRYQQAETLIRAAIRANPETLALKTKLLEIFMRSKNNDAFDAYVDDLKMNGELPASFWDAVYALRPDQVRESGGETALAQANDTDIAAHVPDALEPQDSSIDDDIRAFEAEYSQKSDETITEDKQVSKILGIQATGDHLIEFSVNPMPSPSTQSAKPDSIHLENLISYEITAQTQPEQKALTNTDPAIELAELDLPAVSRTGTANHRATDFGVLDFKLALIDNIVSSPNETTMEPHASPEQIMDNVGTNSSDATLLTQLNLAKACIDREDKTAAKALLQQLAASDSPDIKAEAEATLNRLGKVQLTLVPSIPMDEPHSSATGKTTAAR